MPQQFDEIVRGLAAELSAQISSVGDDAREAASRAKESAYTARKVEAITGELVKRVEKLEKQVFGSDPPPANPTPLVKRTTDGENSMADLTGRVLNLQGNVANLQGEVALVKKQNTDQLVLLDSIKKAVTGVLTHPVGRKIGLAVATIILLWLGTVQARIQQRLDKVSPETADGGTLFPMLP